MATVGSVTRQIAALEISAKQNGATKQTRPLHQKTASQSSQSNVSKLLTKFAAPNPFPDSKPKAKAAAVKTVPPRHANSTQSAATKQLQLQPASQLKPSSGRELDIGKYDGGFEIENEKRGETVGRRSSSGPCSRLQCLKVSVCPHHLRPTYSPVPDPLKNTPHARMAPYRL